MKKLIAALAMTLSMGGLTTIATSAEAQPGRHSQHVDGHRPGHGPAARGHHARDDRRRRGNQRRYAARNHHRNDRHAYRSRYHRQHR
ncbi:hypothetical protein KZ813_06525 [Sphingomonas sp. RHCKR7]|uniref:hypothetical protein n=1 Tax=Sphingomonas folli TaxID=2862497 RepID=UPI001CA4FB35|nr:hypothetical protein [Sphingomonas folli]MBW6526491.1 hypothetical protein [Sphingomonas folli]